MLWSKAGRIVLRQIVSPSKSRRKRRRGPEKPAAESLETRVMLSGNPIWVTNTQDSGNGSLRDAIEEANAAPGQDTIKFHNSASGTINLSSQLLITDDLVIQGPGANRLTVSGQDATRVFLVVPEELASDPYVTPSPAQLATSPEVTIAKLSIADGLATDAPGNPTPGPFAFGGGVYNLGGTVHLENVKMTGNVTSGVLAAGGAVGNEFGGTLTVSGSQFDGNAANGLVAGAGGAISSDLGPTREARSFAIEGSGSADDGFPLPGGGTRDHFIDSGSLTIGGTTFAHTGAGSVQTFTVDFNTFTGTFGSADPFVFTDTDGDSLVTHYGRVDKGALADGSFILLPVEQHPDAPLPPSGDIFAHWVAEFVVQPESTGKYAGVTGSWIMDAYSAPFSSSIGPGGIPGPLDYRWESRGDSQLVFPGVTGQPEVDIDRSSFTDNTASAVLGHIPGVAFSGLAGGGAILNVTGLMSVSYSSFAGNSVQGGAGGVFGATKGGPGFGGAINSSNYSPFGGAQSVLEVSNSSFVGNSATGGSGGDTGLSGGEAAGGAIMVTNAGEANLHGNKYRGNEALGGNGIGGGDGGDAAGGGVAASSGANLTLQFEMFVRNTSIGGSGDGAGGAGRGGALGLFSVDLTGWLPGSANATISHSNVQFNRAQGGDAADTGGDGLGGGIATVDGGSVAVTRSTVVGNRANGGTGTNADGQGLGGGGYNDGSADNFEVDLVSLFWMNSASDDGDDIFGLFSLL